MIKFPILAVWCCSCKSMQESSLDSQVAPTVFACMPSNRIGRIEKTVPTGEKQLPVSSKYFRAPTVSILRRCSYFCVSWASGAQVINLWRQRMLFVRLRGKGQKGKLKPSLNVRCYTGSTGVAVSYCACVVTENRNPELSNWSFRDFTRLILL